MDKPTSAKSQRKKGNKLVRRLLKWRENKSKTNQAVSDSKEQRSKSTLTNNCSNSTLSYEYNEVKMDEEEC